MAETAHTEAQEDKTNPWASRVLYYDVLNILACVAVLMLHFNDEAHHFERSASWLGALVVECVFYWAVPIFFMLSGATLLRYRERYGTRTFLSKRFWRTAVPFVVWSLGALVWKVSTSQMPAPMGPRKVIGLVLNAHVLDVYWFFIPLFALYLAFPILSCLADGRRDRMLWYGVGVAFVCNSVLPCVLPIWGIQYNVEFMSPVFSLFTIYPILGYLLSKRQLTRPQRYAVYLAGLFALVLRYGYTVGMSWGTGKLDQSLWGYTYFPCVLLSIAVFVLAKQIRWQAVFRTPRSVRILSKLAGCSFGVYLEHMICLWYLMQATGLAETRLIWRVGLPLLTYVICVCLTLALKRIPVLRRAVP